MNSTFEFQNTDKGYTTVKAEIIGQLAIHFTVLRPGILTAGYCLSHVKSGHYIWTFRPVVELEQVKRLAEMLACQDFDAYQAGGFQDKDFIKRCKAIFQEWDATYPDRMAYDRLSYDE